MTTTQDLSAVSDALGSAFAGVGLNLEPVEGLVDVPGSLTALTFTDGSDVTPATIIVATDGGLDQFDAAVAALQKAMPGMTPSEPSAIGSVAELDVVRTGVVSHHRITSEGMVVGLLVLEQDRRQTSSEGSDQAGTVPPGPEAAQPVPPTAQPTTDPLTAGRSEPLSGAAPQHTPSATAGGARGLSMLSDVMLNVTVDLGRQSLALSQVLALSVGSVVELDRAAGAPVDIRVNGILFGRGEVVVVDDEYAVRLIEILETPDR